MDKTVDYASRKFVLTVFSVLLFTTLLVQGVLTGDQFVSVYTLVFGLYVGGNVWAKAQETRTYGNYDQ